MPKSNRGIYAIRNIANGKVYVGCSIDIRRRFRTHRYHLRAGTHWNLHLQRAFNRYGPGGFRYDILEVMEDPTQLSDGEAKWIDALGATDERCGYNLIRYAEHRLLSKEVREKMSRSHKALPPFSPEHRAHMSEANRRRTGQPVSEKARAANAIRFLGRHHSEATREKLRALRRGKPGNIPSEEGRAKMSQAQTGKPKSAQHRAHIAEANRGRRHSAETMARMCAIQSNRSEEWRTNLSKGHGRLGDVQVLEMRRRAAGGEGVCALAREFGMGHSSASEIINRKTYRWIP